MEVEDSIQISRLSGKMLQRAQGLLPLAAEESFQKVKVNGST